MGLGLSRVGRYVDFVDQQHFADRADDACISSSTSPSPFRDIWTQSLAIEPCRNRDRRIFWSTLPTTDLCSATVTLRPPALNLRDLAGSDNCSEFSFCAVGLRTTTSTSAAPWRRTNRNSRSLHILLDLSGSPSSLSIL